MLTRRTRSSVCIQVFRLSAALLNGFGCFCVSSLALCCVHEPVKWLLRRRRLHITGSRRASPSMASDDLKTKRL